MKFLLQFVGALFANIWREQSGHGARDTSLTKVALLQLLNLVD